VTKDEAQRDLERALAAASGQRFLGFLAFALLLLAPGGMLGLVIAEWLVHDPGALFAARSDELVLVGGCVLLLGGGITSAIVAFRSQGPRGTPQGRKVLDVPATVESARYFVREITAGGAGLRTVHVVDLAFEDGSSYELHVDARAVPGLLEALRTWLPPSSHVDAAPR
jgi:hypothetical protein